MIHRRDFLKSTCITCLGGGMAAALSSGCKGIHYVNSEMSEDKLVIPKAEFVLSKKKSAQYRQWVIVKNPQITFPIGVFRADETHFYASYLQCTHQGCEVHPEGDYLQCPCHGAAFSHQGKVTQGPAEKDLRTFTVQTDAENIYVMLK